MNQIFKHKKALKHLAKQDAVMAGLVRQINLPPAKKRQNHFRSLVSSIISQQLSTRVAEVIVGRLKSLYPRPFPSAQAILNTPNKKLRAIGLSYQKIAYIKNLASAVKEGEVDFKTLTKKSDEEIITELIKIKGIGLWTAEMFLIFSLSRPDVFSSGDLGLNKAVKKLYNINIKKHPKKTVKLLETWKPFRSLASRLLWQSLKIKS